MNEINQTNKFSEMNEINEMKPYVYWLKTVPGVGNQTLHRMLEQQYSAKDWYTMKEQSLRSIPLAIRPTILDRLIAHRKATDPMAEYEKLQRKGIQFLWEKEEAYPKRLTQIPDAPVALFCLGKLPPEQSPHVAVVGARQCTEYGHYVAKSLGKHLGKAGAVLVSGMARGIDGMGQMAAMEAGGSSIGVLGCGVDICYPKQNRQLYDRLIQTGCVISEYLPGTQPEARLFPARNRIISGLADSLVVVEAREKSGTLITVDMALEQGKEVYVVPGRVTDPLSRGCNALIHQGANVLVSLEDFVAQLQQTRADASAKGCREVREETIKHQEACGLEDNERRIYDLLDATPKSIEELSGSLIVMDSAEQEGFSIQEIMWILLRLCTKGKAKQVGVNHYVKVW